MSEPAHPPGSATGRAPVGAPPEVRDITPQAPLQWLVRGWSDVWVAPGVSLAHGVCVAVFGALLLALARDQFWWLAGAFSGFLLVAPLVATGLYVISRDREAGRTGTALRRVWAVWASLDRRLVGFGVLLALAGTGWVLTSAALITWLSDHPIEAPIDFLRHVVASRDDGLFWAWTLMGGLMAAPVFASTVVTLPLLLDRRVTMWAAVLTSWRAVTANPVSLALWAFILMALTLLGLATAMLGLVLIIPWLGHASWHAYRQLVA